MIKIIVIVLFIHGYHFPLFYLMLAVIRFENPTEFLIFPSFIFDEFASSTYVGLFDFDLIHKIC